MKEFNLSLLVVVLAVSLFWMSCSKPTETAIQKGYPISPIDIKSVKLSDSFWLPKIKLIQDTTIMYAFKKCAEEGRMENFLIAGKVKAGKALGKMPFDDTDLYKTIEGASYSLVSMPNPKLYAYLDSIISIIKTGQEPDGYITTWFTIDRAHPPADWVKPSKERWENEISSHELYNSGHLFEAAAAHYWATGKKNFLDIALKNADLLMANFKPGKVQMPPGHQIVETGLIKLYQITGKEDYLRLSKYFLDLRGDSTSHKLYGEYNQDHIRVTQQQDAVGHAVRAEYMYAAMTDIAAIYHDPNYMKALNAIWNNIVNTKMYITGGVGARHEGEAFGDNYELPNLSAYSETCAAIGSVVWNQRMFLLTGESKYYDIIERTLYNGLISGMSTDGKMFFYPNPLEADGKFQFNKGACTRQSWFDCSCCPTNLIRFIPSLPGLIYATRGDTLFTSLFVSSNAELKIKDVKIKIMQQSGYPWNGNTKFTIEPEKNSIFSLRIRVPGWLRNEAVPGNLYAYVNASGMQPTLSINGEKMNATVADGYITITRDWSPGDVVALELPMIIHEVKTNEAVKDNQNKVAFERGPFVYCAEEVDNKNISAISVPKEMDMQLKKETLAGERVDVLKGKTKGADITLIPYYVWSNRGVDKMKVWLPQE